MATVVQERVRRGSKTRTDPLAATLVSLLLRNKLQEQQQARETEAAGSAASELVRLLGGGNTGPAPGTDLTQGRAAQATAAEIAPTTGGTRLSPSAAKAFATQLVAGGGNPSTALSAILNIEKVAKAERDKARTAEALKQLGQRISSRGTRETKYIGDVLSSENVPMSTKTALINQVGRIFPKQAKVRMRDVEIFTEGGSKRVVRVPSNVANPQAWLDKHMPALRESGFTTVRPAPTDKPTETQRDVNALVQNNPKLREMFGVSPKRARELGRIILRQRPKVIRQLEQDLKREIAADVFSTKSARDDAIFDLARRNIDDIIIEERKTSTGNIVSAAKERAEKQFENLDFLPPQLQLDPKGVTRQKLADIVRYLIRFDGELSTIRGKVTDEEDRFKEAIRLLGNRVQLDENTIQALRTEVLGTGTPKKKGE